MQEGTGEGRVLQSGAGAPPCLNVTVSGRGPELVEIRRSTRCPSLPGSLNSPGRGGNRSEYGG
eukprot:748799-Hanusia_phi.AAC.4